MTANDSELRRWRRALIPVACLLCVALWHLSRVWRLGQSPWKGGGFGMFSSIDSERSRFITVHAELEIGGERQTIPVVIPSSLTFPSWELRVLPNESDAQSFAQLLSQRAWRLETNPPPVIAPASPDLSPERRLDRQPAGRLVEVPTRSARADDHSHRRVEPLTFTVEVWKCEWNAATRQLSAKPLVNSRWRKERPS